MDSNHRPSGYEPDELPLLHAALLRRTDLLSRRASRQYHRRCRVSRPGSGWSGVGPRRIAHATGAGGRISTPFLRVQRRHVRRPSREALVHAHASPLPLTGPPAGAAFPVVCRGTYRPVAVSGVILGGISHLDAFSGSCLRTWLRSLRAAPQLLHQRSVHSGPLVLRAAPRTPLPARSG